MVRVGLSIGAGTYCFGMFMKFKKVDTMGQCAQCRHWRPHAGSPTNMVCTRIGSAPSDEKTPRLMLDLVVHKDPETPLRMATPSHFGCTLYEESLDQRVTR